MKKARMGLAHVMVFNNQHQELQENYSNSGFVVEPMNPRDDKFIYF